MRLTVDGNAVVVSMEDEGRHGFLMRAIFRRDRDTITPTIVVESPDGQSPSTSDLLRAIRSMSPVQVVPMRGSAFPFVTAAGQSVAGSRRLQAFKRLGVIGR